MAMHKEKKLKLDEKSAGQSDADATEQIDGELVLSIEKLQETQDELEKINEEASDRVLVVEQKYSRIRKPIYEKRSEIIKSIPDFWLTAFMGHPAISALLTEEDQKIFKYMSSIEVEDFEDVKSGYSITFNFNPNPYFEDMKLTKTFSLLDEGTIKITATSINWKEGKGIPNGVVHEKKGSKRPCNEESFFLWFSEAQGKDYLDEIHDQVAQIIKEDLWTNPLTFFSNEMEEDFEDGEGDEEDGSDDSDDDDEEGDDDEDGDDED